jgi:ubiquinone/menaquinone biosynthesis C-methylase UbiE
MKEIEFYFKSYSETLNKKLAGTSGIVAELGAGSCGLSVCLSRLSNVNQIYALDISISRMNNNILTTIDSLGGNRKKIDLIAANFNERLPFEDEALDAVLFDAALHHSRSMWHLLSECQRVLKGNGLLIAQRESYLSAFRSNNQLDRLLETPEVSSNVTENMYLKKQYEYYLKVHGFNVSFLPRSPSKLKSCLRILNGTIFCDGVFLCHKK